MFCLLALFLIALGATADEEIDFEVEIEYETGKKYIIHPGPADWATAYYWCREQDSNLVIIGSEEENSLITEKLLALYPATEVRAFWTSGVRDRVLKEFLWWDGSNFTYSNWRESQPDNYEGLEHCVTTSVSSKWNDLNCDSQVGIICEMSLSTASFDKEEMCCDFVDDPEIDNDECFQIISQKVTDFHQKTFDPKIRELEQMLSMTAAE